MPEEQKPLHRIVKFELSASRPTEKTSSGYGETAQTINLTFLTKPDSDFNALATLVFDWFSKNRA